MEITLNEEVKTIVKLRVVRFTKDYLEKIAMVEIMKCIENIDTGELIRKDHFQNRVFQNRTVSSTIPSSGDIENIEVKDFDLLIEHIQQLGEEPYFQKLLEIIVTETVK